MLSFLKLSLKRGIRPGLQAYLGQSPGQCSRGSHGSSSYPVYRIRKATQKDVPAILKFIKELAVFEKQPLSSITISEEELLRDGFGEHRYFHCLLPECVTSDKVLPVGFTIYYFTYSTWRGKVLHVDDLYVKPEYRRKGVAALCKSELCKEAAANDCCRIQWLVFDWNKDAFTMYDDWGAIRIPEYVVYEFPREAYLKHVPSE